MIYNAILHTNRLTTNVIELASEITQLTLMLSTTLATCLPVLSATFPTELAISPSVLDSCTVVVSVASEVCLM